MPSKKPGQKPGIPLGQKRKKNIFDDDSDDEGKQNDNAVEVSTLGGLDVPAPKSKPANNAGPPPKRKMQFGAGKPNAKPLSKNSIFADDEDEDEENEKKRQSEVKFGLNASSKTKATEVKDFTNLSALHSSKKHAKEAEELDPSIYSYDAVYDSLHAKPDKASTANKSEVPKYMENLLRSAEIRKRDQLRARDRQLAKEREAEGDEFADKESFVTGAYKAQQAEMRKVEEEEAQREKEEEERKRKNGGSGMVDFYRDMLSRGEAKHEQVVKAAEEAAKKIKEGETTEETAAPEEKSEAQKAADLNAQGAHIAVNDEGQVVDKRQLLSAGLNVAPKPKTAPAAEKPASRGPVGRPAFAGNQAGRGAQRARQTEMITRQLEEQARQEEEAEAARQKELAEKNRSRKTAGDVSSAKERYLARKREKEEAAAKEKAG